MDNPFLKEIDTFYNRVIELQSTLFQIDNVLRRDLKKQKSTNEKTKDKFTIKSASRLVISDLSGPTDNGWEINFPTDYNKIIKWSEYDQEIENLIAREAGYTIAQSCEAFVRFLRNVVAIQLMHNQGEAIAIDKKFSDCKTEEEFKTRVRKVSKLRSTENLFQTIEDTCRKFKSIKEKNNLGIELTNFYEILAFVRHKVTHSSSRFSPSETNNWSESLHAIFENYFATVQLKKDLLIKMNKQQANRVVKRTAELGFIIFKSLSICNNYEWNILEK